MEFGKKIVAVDDSNIILKMLKNVLDKKYDLHPFVNGLRALEYLADRTPDLIILDIDMPVMNGFEMLKTIKGMEHLKDVPVIFLTSNSDKKHVVKAVTSGAVDYVVKPIDVDILLGKIDRLLSDTD